MIKEWYENLNLMDKIYGAIISIAVTGILKKVYSCLKPDPIKKAFKNALKKNAQNLYVLKYYNERREKSIEEFCNQVISSYGKYDENQDKLYLDFRKELERTEEGRAYLQSIQQEGIGNGLQELLQKVDKKLLQYRELDKMLREIRADLQTHHRGKRQFDKKEDYLQRYCSRSISDKDYLDFIIHNKLHEKYKLVDIVLGKTEYKENKYILLSGAHTGKTTELERLGWELIEEGSKVPIMFKISTCKNLRQELPALKPEIEKGLVVIIDALDERFNGQERLDLYREIEGYSDEHPNVAIVLSLRANFSKEREIKGFCKLALHDLTDDDARNYFLSRGQEELVDYINDRKYHEFIRIPFCLMAMADCYQEKGSLPSSKSEIYDFFIEQSLIREEKKGLYRITSFVDKEKELLQRTAVGLQLMGANNISDTELLALVGNEYEMLDLVLMSGLVDGGKGKGYWFSHNSFKEFFVSKYLLSLNNLNDIKRICCYKGMDYIKAGWYNTIALMLDQLSPNSELSKQILEWIVKDNTEMVLLIDNKLFSKEARVSIFKKIVEEYKEKDIRIADMWSSEYEEMMNFGASEESVGYLIKELTEYDRLDSHMVNVLLLLRYVRKEDIPLEMARELNAKIISLFRENCEDDDFDYVFFEALENPWMLKETTADELYEFIKDSKQPSLLIHYIGYLIRAKCAAKYIDFVLDKSQYIYPYRKGQYSRSIMRDHLYEAYKDVDRWEDIKKVLKHIADNYQSIDHSMDKEKELAEGTIKALLEKTAQMVGTCTDAPEYIFEILGVISEDRYSVTDKIAKLFLSFYEKTDATQRFYEKAIEYLWNVFITDTISVEGSQEHKKLEVMAYCASLFLTEDRLEELCDSLTNGDYKSYSLLSWLEEKSSPEMKELIDVKMRSRFRKYWHDKNALSKWQKKEQKDYDQLMDYEWFKGAVLQILDEKMPQKKEDVHSLRKMKFEFSDEEEDRLNDYIIRLFYWHLKGDCLDVKSLKDNVCDYEKYRELTFVKTFDLLTSKPQKRIVITDEQRKQYVETGQKLLRKLADKPFNNWVTLNNCAEIRGLLLHHYTIEDEVLLKLIPYSKCYVYNAELEGVLFSDTHYTLLNYLEEKFNDDKETLFTCLRETFENINLYEDEQLQQWAEFVVKHHITSEYKRIIEWMIAMQDHSPAYCIAKALLNGTETKEFVLKKEVMDRCSVSKRSFIYEELASDSEKNEFVVEGLEADFARMKDYEKKRAIMLLLSKGSMMALNYLVDHTDVLDFRNVFHYRSLDALELLLTVYTKVIDSDYRSDYNGIIEGIGEIAKVSDENWMAVHQRLTDLIKKDRDKYVHFNFYLEKWKAERLELSTPAMRLEEVLELLKVA